MAASPPEPLVETRVEQGDEELVRVAVGVAGNGQPLALAVPRSTPVQRVIALALAEHRRGDRLPLLGLDANSYELLPVDSSRGSEALQPWQPIGKCCLSRFTLRRHHWHAALSAPARLLPACREVTAC
eukprot:SM000011S19078  [mRNA]  locus=s11:744301:744969:- [translate_table: standard]